MNRLPATLSSLSGEKNNQPKQGVHKYPTARLAVAGLKVHNIVCALQYKSCRAGQPGKRGIEQATEQATNQRPSAPVLGLRVLGTRLLRNYRNVGPLRWPVGTRTKTR